MFDVLMYLFETYIHGDMDTTEELVDQNQLTEELIHVGFHYDDIDKALHWMERLAALQNSDTVPYLISANPHSIRLYTVLEMARLDSECRGFLLFLERIQILNPETREMVIDRVMELESSALSLENLKWVVLMVLFNVPGHESAYHQMEALLFEFNNTQFH